MSARLGRALLGLLLPVLLVLASPSAVEGLSVRLSLVTHVGSGAARLTLYTTGAGRLYVNLKGLSPGNWKEELWSGTCASPSPRLAVLRTLIVPASGRIARTDVLTSAQAKGRVLRVLRGSQVLCASFTPTVASQPSDPLAFYVATTGSDSNPGTAASPWRTIQKAVNTVRPGSTVTVLSGTYAGFVVRRSGTSAAPILIRGAAGTRPRIAGSGEPTVVEFNNSHDITLTGFDISGAAGPRETGAGIRVQAGARDIRILNSAIHDNVTQGINLSDAVGVTVRNNQIWNNAIGVQVTRAGDGVQILDNDVHDNDQMVRDTPQPNDDYGAVGIAFVGSTGAVTVARNRLWANRAPSQDYGWDGGAFEIFGASNVSITENVTWDNENILETGTNGDQCSDNLFARNVSYGAVTRGRTLGIFLRCAHNMRVVNNTIADLGTWAFSVLGDDKWAGSIDGLEIVNNIVVTDHGKIYGFETTLPASAVVGHNLVFNSGGGEIATVVGRGSTKSLAVLRSWLGQQAGDIGGDPRFVDRDGHDYHLRTGSPAIDQGALVQGVTQDYKGAAPDIGRFEFVPPTN